MESRGKKLRDSFNINEKSKLRNRDLRNAWEHFDERLDVYLVTLEAGQIFPDPTLGSHELADEQAGHIFKLLDIENECLVLMGQKFFFSPLREEVQEIYDISMTFDENGCRLKNNN